MKNYQAIFLNTLRREGQTVTIITTNGYQLKGRITAFDQDTLVIEGKDGQQLTYKHAISTISGRWSWRTGRWRLNEDNTKTAQQASASDPLHRGAARGL